MTALHIVNNDQTFLDWLKKYPNGYVLNTYLNPSPNYMMLHTADCSYWRKDYASENTFTGQKYSKVVAENIYELQEWMKKNGRPDGTFKGIKNNGIENNGIGCRCLSTQVTNENIKAMTIFEQVIQVCESKNQDSFFRSEIIDFVEKEFGRKKDNTVIPADYCYNRINKGMNFANHAFIFNFEDSKYQFVGENFAYSGYIYAVKDKKRRNVGLWKNGKFCLWEDFPVKKDHPKRTYDPIELDSYNSAFLENMESSRRDSSAARQARLKEAAKIPTKITVVSQVWVRDTDVIKEVLDRANGQCEKCCKPAPFYRKKDGTPYLEVHHKIQLASGGEDTVENAIALCPNCHREQHFGNL